MTETTVRELLDRLVDDGVPPGVGVPVDEVMQRNGRLLRRRRSRRAGLAGALLAAAAGVVVLLPNLSGADPAPPATKPLIADSAPPTRAATASPAPTGTPSPEDPAASRREETRSRERAQAMMSRLVQAVPSYYTVPAAKDVAVESGYVLREIGWYRSQDRGYQKPTSMTMSFATLEVQLDGRAALLSFRASRMTTPPPAALCGTRMDPQEQDCRIVPGRDGAPVRIAGWRTAAGPTRQAVRFYDGWYVHLEQSSHPRPGVYGLGRAVLSDEELADLVADPAFGP